MTRDPGQATALQAIARALTSDQAQALLAAARQIPELGQPDTRELPDVLGRLGDTAAIPAIEAFHAQHDHELPDSHGTAYAAIVLTLTGQPLTVTAITSLLQHVGLPADPPRPAPGTISTGRSPLIADLYARTRGPALITSARGHPARITPPATAQRHADPRWQAAERLYALHIAVRWDLGGLRPAERPALRTAACQLAAGTRTTLTDLGITGGLTTSLLADITRELTPHAIDAALTPHPAHPANWAALHDNAGTELRVIRSGHRYPIHGRCQTCGHITTRPAHDTPWEHDTTTTLAPGENPLTWNPQ